MVKSTLYKGIEFVRISLLPPDQQVAMKKTFDHHLVINILIDGNIVSDCVQFSDYISWYQSFFVRAPFKKIEINSSSQVPELIKNR